MPRSSLIKSLSQKLVPARISVSDTPFNPLESDSMPSSGDETKDSDIYEPESDIENATTKPSDHDITKEYAVHAIHDSRVSADMSNTVEYKVSWEDYWPRHNDWQPEGNLHSAAKLVRAFHRRHPQKPRSSITLFDPSSHFHSESEDGARTDSSNLDSSNLEYTSDSDFDSENSDTDTRVYSTINKIFKRHRTPLEDDPQVDWQDYDDPDVLSAAEADAQDEASQQYLDQAILDSAQAYYGPNIAPTDPLPVIRFSNAYVDFVKKLCTQTSTQNCIKYMNPGLLFALQHLRNTNIINEFSLDTLGDYTYGLALSIWLTICLRLHSGRKPLEIGGASLLCQALALTDMEITGVKVKQDVKTCLQYWEYVLSILIDGRWLENLWYTSVPSGAGLFRSKTRNEVEETFLTSLEHGIPYLADTIIDKECEATGSPLKAIVKVDRGWIHSELVKLLASADPAILKACITGQLIPCKENENSSVGTVLAEAYDRGDSIPGIYGNYITDDADMSPTPAMYAEICSDIERYTKTICSEEDHRWAAIIDQTCAPPKSWPSELTLQGFRRYLDWRTVTVNKTGKLCNYRRKVLSNFNRQLLKRVRQDRYAGKFHTPLQAAIAEIGYSIRPKTRLAEHKQHRSSNYIMNLVDAMLRCRYGGSFNLKQGVLFSCWHFSQPWLGEIAFTQLAQGYVQGAGGFSHYPAGFSNGSAWSKTPMRQWAMYQRNALQDGSLMKTMGAIQQALDAELASFKESAATSPAGATSSTNNLSGEYLALDNRRRVVSAQYLKALIRRRQAELDELKARIADDSMRS
ncbi:MAG: hypothetical protein M1830_002698 [Pleopsidium flavum]|nr:MAG: hypothetical protein M1830_002698 [Pleopsidium flavum]